MQKQLHDPTKTMYPDVFPEPEITDDDPDSLARDAAEITRHGMGVWLLVGIIVALAIFAFLLSKVVSTSVGTKPGTQLVNELDKDPPS